MARRIDGRAILETVHNNLAFAHDLLVERGTKVAILHFAAPPLAEDELLRRITAAQISTRAKLRTFRRIGVDAVEQQLPANLTAFQFSQRISQLNQDPTVAAIIVQHPVRPDILQLLHLIAPEKDIDALNPDTSEFEIPATAEAIYRVATAFLEDKPLVAVVGSNGFVGRGVVACLKREGASVLAIDARDPGYTPERLLDIASADLVITATGQSNVLDERHLKSHHRIVIDCGFSPGIEGVVGDVKTTAYEIPQVITPVPGGIGPLEMGVLAERLVQKELDLEFQPWSMKVQTYQNRMQVVAEQTRWAEQIYPIALQLLSALEERVQRNANDIVLMGERYELRLERTSQHLFLSSKDGRGLIVQYSVQPPPAQLFNAVTLKDLKAWIQIEDWLERVGQLEQSSQQPPSELEP